MPELPDIELYAHAVGRRIIDRRLTTVRIGTPFLLRSVDPPLAAVAGRTVVSIRRLGKRLAIQLDPDYWLIIHLMIAGRLQWHDDAPNLASKSRLASFDFDVGSLLLTEAGTKKRASLYLVDGTAAMLEHDPGGIEPLQASLQEFATELATENRTLKRILSDPRRFSGIGNAFSDEILHRAKLSPAKLTSRLDEGEVERLFAATRETLEQWRQRLIDEAGDDFPRKVSAFKKGMAAHGRYGKPCPECGDPIQRIRYKSRETNYCPTCQTGGKLLADRSLSRLLKDSWPDKLS